MSLNIDPSQWRLRTAGGIPYKLMEGYPRGKVGDEVSIQEELVIRAEDLVAFCWESFSHIKFLADKITYNQGRQCPNLPGLFTVDVTFEPFEQGKPSDPFDSDSSADSGTYAQFMKIMIDYGPRKQGSPDGSNDDVKDFLEVTEDTEAEVIAVDPMSSAAQWQNFDIWNDPDTGKTWDAGALLPLKSPDVQVSKIIVETGWNVQWKRVSATALPFLITRMRSCVGMVNSLAMPLLHDAEPGTILFKGHNSRIQYLWGGEEQPPVTLTQKFTEKRVVEDGTAKGHNYMYRPETGKFELYLVNGNPIYNAVDLNTLWTF